jgi:glycosyltransferase involved in cell wall biosynthesis
MARRVPTTLIAFGARPKRLKLENLEVRVLRNWLHVGRFKFNPFTPMLAPHLARADVIHVHQPETLFASLGLVFAKLTGKRIFSTHLGGAGLGLHRLVNVTDWYHGHLHLSAFSRRTFGQEDLPTSHVALAGVDTEQFAPDPSIPRDGGPVFVGRLHPHKVNNYLIEAMDPDIQMTIVGRRWQHAQKYHGLLEELSRGKQVHFVEGRQFEPGVWAPEGDNAIIADACRRGLCIVLPSVHETVYGEHHPIPELLGLVLLEGMACGAPAIVTDVCSLPEVVVDGVTGFVVPPNDASALRQKIRWLKDHPAAAAEMGRAARQRVLDHFTWDRVVQRCLDAYGDAAPAPTATVEV